MTLWLKPFPCSVWRYGDVESSDGLICRGCKANNLSLNHPQNSALDRWRTFGEYRFVSSRQRIFSDADRENLLKALGACREACVQASIRAPITGPIYTSIGLLMKAIDGVAMVLTGDFTYFHLKDHSI